MADCYGQMGKWVDMKRWSCSAEEAALPTYQRLNHCQAAKNVKEVFKGG